MEDGRLWIEGIESQIPSTKLYKNIHRRLTLSHHDEGPRAHLCPRLDLHDVAAGGETSGRNRDVVLTRRHHPVDQLEDGPSEDVVDRDADVGVMLERKGRS